MKTILSFLILCGISINSYSAQFLQSNVEIDRLGSHPGQIFFLNLKEAFKTDCTGSNLYCPTSNESCKNYYSLVLAAKMANKKLLEIYYTQDTSSKYCSIDLVQIN